jgi:tetratricopeptide (TPR) repeat protein
MSMISYGDGSEIPAPAVNGANLPRRATPFLAGAWPLVVLLTLATLPYVGILRNDFAYVYDDKAQIIDNPYVHSFGHLRETLTTSVWSYAGAGGVTHYYRPAMTIGFLLCYQLFGPLAYGFHLTSLLLHAAVVAMLFLFAERLFRDRGAALGAAGLFALHPVHVESVAWISAVTDLEVTFFSVLTFWCFLQVGEQRGRRQVWAQSALAVSFLMALLSKELALTLPLLAVIYEHFYRDDRAETTCAQKVGRYGALWLLSMGYLLVRVHLVGSLAHPMGMHPLTLIATIYSALALLGQYIFKLLWPAHLSAFYVFQASTNPLEAPVLEGVAALILCLVVFGVMVRKARPASFGLVWLLGTLAPVLNARWMGPYVLADRYFYLPSVGFCLVAGWAGAAVWRAASERQGAWRWAVVAGASIVAALCVLRIVTRIPDWRDDVTLFSRALATEPDEFVLHDALGDAYWIRGEEALAEHEWKETLRINPSFIRPVNALGALCGKQRRYGEAVAYLQRAILLIPADADAHLNLGAVYAEMGSLDRAEEQFRTAVSLAPLNFAAHNVLGKLYFDSGRLNEAEEQFRESVASDRNLAALDYLGYICQRRGDSARAEEAFKEALALDGTDSHALFNLGLVYAATGRNAQALEEMQAALAADPDNPEIRSALEKLRR